MIREPARHIGHCLSAMSVIERLPREFVAWLGQKDSIED